MGVERLKEWPKTGKPGHYKGDRAQPVVKVRKPKAAKPAPESGDKTVSPESETETETGAADA